MATKTALKAASDNTFTTNGVRAITAASHRTFNNTLIDSLDVVGLLGTNKQIATAYVIIPVNSALEFNSTMPVYSDKIITKFPMTLVKDQLLGNVLHIEMVNWVQNLSTMTIWYDAIGFYHFAPAIYNSSYLGAKVLDISNTPYNHTGAILAKITYIPAE